VLPVNRSQLLLNGKGKMGMAAPIAYGIERGLKKIGKYRG
jgi:hypothetical protein